METIGKPRRRRRALWTLVHTTLCCAVLACGGSQTTSDHYQKSVDKQRECCSQLGDPSERASCLDQIVTVEDEAVAESEVNQATFACMEEHFVCDPTTGRATEASAQAQLDCLNDIDQ